MKLKVMEVYNCLGKFLKLTFRQSKVYNQVYFQHPIKLNEVIFAMGSWMICLFMFVCSLHLRVQRPHWPEPRVHNIQAVTLLPPHRLHPRQKRTLTSMHLVDITRSPWNTATRETSLQDQSLPLLLPRKYPRPAFVPVPRVLACLPPRPNLQCRPLDHQ